MTALTREIYGMVELLQESEQRLILEIVRRFLPDDVATPDDLKAIAAARDEYKCGKTVGDNEIDWD